MLCARGPFYGLVMCFEESKVDSLYAYLKACAQSREEKGFEMSFVKYFMLNLIAREKYEKKDPKSQTFESSKVIIAQSQSQLFSVHSPMGWNLMRDFATRLLGSVTK